MKCQSSIWILATPISELVGPSISSVTIDIEDFDIECSFDIDVLHLRYCMSTSKVFDIEGHQPLISKVMIRVVDIEVSSFRYRLNIVRHRMLISYTISKVNLTFDIEGHAIICRVRYRIRYSTPMSFTAERKLPLPRAGLHHAGTEESQRHEPWIPAPSFCGIPQLDPQRFDEKRSFHSAASTC
jgi:hypothetical protein